MKLGTGQKLYKKAKKIIPGGNQLLSKRPEMFLPDFWPSYYEKAAGCEVWVLDGNNFFDMSFMGIGTCSLGYANPEVNKAVKTSIEKGSFSTLNSHEEVELAEKLIDLHPYMEMVRFGRCGGEANAISVRIARAVSGKSKIAVCGYHGWHDWYLAANHKSKKNLDFQLLPGLKPLGVPKGLSGTIIPFRFNSWEDFEKIIKKNIKNSAAIVIEPCREGFPDRKYLLALKKIAKMNKSILIFDEITSGWRLNSGGAHKIIKVDPDMVIYGKTIANGVPMSAIVGKKKIMA